MLEYVPFLIFLAFCICFEGWWVYKGIIKGEAYFFFIGFTVFKKKETPFSFWVFFSLSVIAFVFFLYMFIDLSGLTSISHDDISDKVPREIDVYERDN